MPNKPFMAEVESPCCRKCCLDEREICLGCFRSLAEILSWHDAGTAQRRQILEQCQSRRKYYDASRKEFQV